MTLATPVLCDLENWEHELVKAYPNYWNNDMASWKTEINN